MSLHRPLHRFLSSHRPLCTPHPPSPLHAPPTPRAFSQTASPRASPGRPKVDRRISLIRYHLQHPLTPRPLRLSRNRSLRHWTIHRAWLVFQKRRRDAARVELERQYAAMRQACEKLRLLGDDGVEGGAGLGRLYRQSLDKAGVWLGVPVEYARGLADWPAREGWNHAWKARK